ncbi:DUF1573 domain-containing protein [Flavobacterium cerinum]|uniref:DUF1573 domain-containing protein n=1 Tax=Flavobacterium cerinum TaxID=2502784 RepID=A0A444GLA4_9FLAO|nr:DUF1573 domain-containing protein [Flavobacterium cerinum]RWW91763.1 DUF1573 domain-containing protein [Flavobacterium cerinum]
MNNYKIAFLPVLLLIILLSGCQNDTNPNGLTTITIEDPIRHYSPVIQGQEQDIVVKVFNTGDNLLKISKVYPSCGCTIAKFPESAIAPGKFGLIELKYNSNKNIGYVGVYTTIVTNSKKRSETVFFDLNVVPDADYTKDYEELHSLKNEKIGLTQTSSTDQFLKKGYTTNSYETL